MQKHCCKAQQSSTMHNVYATPRHGEEFVLIPFNPATHQTANLKGEYEPEVLYQVYN